jgi:D-aspartate ligase
MEEAPAIVTPLDEHMGLDIARALKKHGITVYGIDEDRTVAGQYSNACRFIKCPNFTENNGTSYLNFLEDFGKKLGRKAVLYPLSDWHVLFFSKHRNILEKYYTYTMPDDDTIRNLTTKDGLQTIATQYQIPVPQTIFIDPDEDIESIASRVIFPAVLKPTESTYWHTPQIGRMLRKGLLDGRAKVIVCRDQNQLIQAYQKIAAYDNHLVVQEIIPGSDDHLVYISFYLNRHSQPLGIFAGRKYRVIPIGFGSASYVRSFHDPALEEIALKLLSSVNYQGLGGIEFKLDPRDNQYKLIEFNTRYGMWDGLGVYCGVDLPYIAYRDALNLPVESQFDYRDDVIWVDWQRDLRAAILYWQGGQLTLKEWLSSLHGEKMWAIYNRKDWRPGVAFTGNLIIKLLDRLINFHKDK